MYRLSRILLIVALLSGIYSLLLLVVLVWPASGWLLGTLAFLSGVRRARGGIRHLSTLGSARWAHERDLRRTGMLNAKSGLILGRML